MMREARVRHGLCPSCGKLPPLPNQIFCDACKSRLGRTAMAMGLGRCLRPGCDRSVRTKYQCQLHWRRTLKERPSSDSSYLCYEPLCREFVYDGWCAAHQAVVDAWTARNKPAGIISDFWFRDAGQPRLHVYMPFVRDTHMQEMPDGIRKRAGYRLKCSIILKRRGSSADLIAVEGYDFRDTRRALREQGSRASGNQNLLEWRSFSKQVKAAGFKIHDGIDVRCGEYLRAIIDEVFAPDITFRPVEWGRGFRGDCARCGGGVYDDGEHERCLQCGRSPAAAREGVA